MSYDTSVDRVIRAGLYCRISEDDGTALGVKRQEDDGRAEAARRDWEVAHVYVDNDVSATRSKVRPDYERALKDFRDGVIDALVIWDADRLTRTPREAEDLIDLVNERGLLLANCTGAEDLSTSDGRLMFRIKIAMAKREIEQMQKRLRRKYRQNALDGKPHGRAAYGYRRERVTDANGRVLSSHDVIEPTQAAVIREAAARVLDGESLRQVAATLNARGIPAPEAPSWVPSTLRQVLRRPSIAGLRRYQGKIVGKTLAEPIIDEATFQRLEALFTDPARKGNTVGPAPKHLLSGLLTCGRCGGSMRRLQGRLTTLRSGRTKRQPPAYCCQSCHRVRRAQATLDALVTELTIARLSQPDAVGALFTRGDAGSVAAAQDAIAVIDAKLALAADQFTEDAITGEQLKRITTRLRAEREQHERELSASLPTRNLEAFTRGDVHAAWDAATLEDRRAVIRALYASITILPQGSGRKFDRELVQVEWAQG